MITRVEQYRTEDGKIFHCYDLARKHEKLIYIADKIKLTLTVIESNEEALALVRDVLKFAQEYEENPARVKSLLPPKP